MSKFGAIIEQAKSQNVGKPEINKTGKPENQNPGKQKNQNTRKTDNQKSIKLENQITRNQENKIVSKSNDREVNLSIKVSERRRRHWAAEAKRQGTSLTAVILESLSKKFGEPE
jgi:hypothetical protein